MGLERTCRATLDGTESEGKAHCGDGLLEFRGEFRLSWKWSEIAVSAADGALCAKRGSNIAEFHLGDDAAKWLHAIQNPKSLLDKLGVKPGHRWRLIGEFDAEFQAQLAERTGNPADPSDHQDWAFVFLSNPDELSLLLSARQSIFPAGGIWAVWKKGQKVLTENHIREFALANGLVDVKVASFSPTLSALKLVVPVALRS